MRLLIVVNVDWFFISHRLPIALAALRAGYEVHIATTLTYGRSKLESYGFVVHSIGINRSSSRVSDLVRLFLKLLGVFREVRPALLHLVTIKPVLIGGLAARFSSVGGVVYAVSGLGHVFIANSVLANLRRALIGRMYRLAFSFPNKRVIFQNSDDQRTLSSYVRLRRADISLLPGSGVDLKSFSLAPLPKGTPVVLMATRLLRTKGVQEFVAAAQQLRLQGLKVRFLLAGEPDSDNPASVTTEELCPWIERGTVEILGKRSDIANLMAQAHIVVLPSYYREGLPKVLIEAAACGRAVITTDMPGCRDAIIPGETGLLVPARDSNALANAIKSLVENRALCEAMGRAGRVRAEREFGIEKIVDAHLKIYRQLLDNNP
jgi:glycosyltransferase involved in cell wall biosynthesis